DCFHEPLAQPVRSIVFVDKYIAQIGEDSEIRDDPREADLFLPIVQPKNERIGKRTRCPFSWTSLGPIGAREKIANFIQIQSCRISANSELVLFCFEYFLHGVSLSWVILSFLLREAPRGQHGNLV